MLQELLKDPQQKCSLKQNRLPVNDVPALHVLHNCKVDSQLSIVNENAADCEQDTCMQGYVPGLNEKKCSVSPHN